jgi:hypothetical protein
MVVSGTGIVLCRLAAILLFVRGIENLGYMMPMALATSTGSWQAGFSSVIAGFVPLIAGLLVWRSAATICNMQNVDVDPHLAEQPNSQQLIAIGTFLVGLYVLLFGIVSATTVETSIWAQAVLNENTTFPKGSVWIRQLPSRIPYILQIVLGIGLILGRSTIAKFFDKVRYAGTGAS